MAQTSLRREQPDLHQTDVMALSDPRWLAFVQSQADATVFHHPTWANMLAETYGYRPLVLTQSSMDGLIVAGIPLLEIRSRLTGRRFISLPFTDYCPPLAQDPESLSLLSAGLMAWRVSVGDPLIEVRGELPLTSSVHVMAAGVRHVLLLEGDCDGVLRRFNRSQVQRGIRRAQRDEVHVRIATSCAELMLFYDLHLRTRRRLGVPVQPRRFFEAMWSQLIDADFGFVSLAYKDSHLIAGAVFLAWNGTVIYKYGASDARYWRFRPNHLIMWMAIQWGCANGYRQFDFGRSDFDDQGLRDFKNGWGTTEAPLIYSYLADKPPGRVSDAKKRFLVKVIQHSPAIVCRGIGELLYGHFG